ncbi:MAG: ParA family protein [Ruminococcus sp.]|nr:ParA family protein [Ruminococcus sp.]
MIISVISEKGGVGKSTCAVNIAKALTAQGKKVLVVDLDGQANASKALGFSPDGKLSSAELIYNTVAGIQTDMGAVVRQSEDGTDYIPASQMLTGIVTFIANDTDSNYVLRRAFSNSVFKEYDYIFFDCRTLLDLLAANALNASNRVIIPVESGLYSYMGLHQMIDKVQSINNSTNRDLKILGILLNKQQRTSVAQEIARDVRDCYGNFVFKTAVPYCPAQAEQAVMGGKITVKQSSLQTAFTQIAKEVIERSV